MNMDAAIRATGLTRRFGPVLAVDHVDFRVERGEVFGFLGPNGAGKTTTVRMLTGVILPTEGTATVEGRDVVREAVAARENIAVVPEEANVYVDLTVRQNVLLMAELHGVAKAARTERTRELLELFGLGERVDQSGKKLSKGLRQRLMLCMALVSEPAVLFLDEPTTGLDVASARLIRELVGQLNRERGMTVFLTTHNIEEAGQLCHRIAVINTGRIAAIDTPEALRGRFEELRSVEVSFARRPLGAEDLSGIVAVGEVKPMAAGFKLYTTEPGRVAQEVVRLAAERGADIESIHTHGPALEDVFVRLTSERGAGEGDDRD